MAKNNISEIDKQVNLHIIPVLYEWGLERHPSQLAEFGRYENGFLYQFVDKRDFYNVKLCDIHIFRKDLSLMIEGSRGIVIKDNDDEIPIIGSSDVKDVFVLTRPVNFISLIRNKLDLSFRLKQKYKDKEGFSSCHIVSEVLNEMPRLKEYLYG